MSVYHECKSSQNLKTLIQNNHILVLKLGAVWCGPCQVIKPEFENVANTTINNLKKLGNKAPSIIFLSIDIDDICQATGQKWGDHLNCSGVPMFIIFAHGKTKETFMGGDLNPVMNSIDESLNQMNQVLNTTPLESL